MSELDDTLSRILSSPESMEKIASLAASLSHPEGGTQQNPVISAQEGGADIGKLASLLKTVSASDNASALLKALKPFLSQERSHKVDAAMSAARIAQAARLALANGSTGAGGAAGGTGT